MERVKRSWKTGVGVVFLLGFAVLAATAGNTKSKESVGTPQRSTSNAGNAWKYDYFDNFYDIASAGAKEVWIVGNNGRIVHSGDVGKTWQIQASNVQETLYSTSFSDPMHGWCSGTKGVILHTENGGQSWSAQNSGTTLPIFKIRFLNEKVGFACGYFGLFLRTADGGKTWVNGSIGEDVTLRGMSFLSEKVGYVVGEFGTILKTTNGGLSFSRLASPVSLTLFATHFSSEQHGYASGVDGTIVQTADGGRTWKKIESGVKDHLIGICGNGHTAIAIGLRGRIVLNDSGNGWVTVDAKTLNWLSGIVLDSGNQGFIVGAHGTILKIEDILVKEKDRG